MEYISVKDFAEKHGVSERTVRNYCAKGKIEDAVLIGKTWSVPADALLPERASRNTISPLLSVLREQKAMQLKGGIYHKTQIDLTYNSNHIEGSKLTHEQTRYIFETHTIGIAESSVKVDDIVETVNHFRCIELVIDQAESRITEKLIKELHRILKTGTTDSLKSWFNVGEYKQLPNVVGDTETCSPEEVHRQIKRLLSSYNASKKHTFDEILDFHHRFESIHPFQDGNGRVGRLLMFKECLSNGITPFIITEELKNFYYRGLANWPATPGYLRDTCLTAQDQYKTVLDYFKIEYSD